MQYYCVFHEKKKAVPRRRLPLFYVTKRNLPLLWKTDCLVRTNSGARAALCASIRVN